MGSVRSYETAKGKRWSVRYRDPSTRKQVEARGFTSKRLAEDKLAEVTTDVRRGTYIDPQAGRVTIGDAGAKRLEQRRPPIIKRSTWDSEESTWRVHVEPRWGRVALASVRHSDVQAWISDLAARRSASTVLRAHGILLAILEDGVRDRRILSNPAADVDLPRKTPAPRHYLSHKQVEELAKGTREPRTPKGVQNSHSLGAEQRATIVRTLAYTGLRWGELVALRVRHVNFLRRRISVEENAPTSRGKIHVGTPKTHERRSVAIPAFLADELAALCEGKGRDALLFGDGTTYLRTPSSQDGWFSVAVRACRAADGDFPHVTPHDMRHTAASLAVSAGANVKAVQRMLGHKSAAMTLDTYADLFDDDLDAVSDRLDAARSASDVGKRWAGSASAP